MNKTMNIKRIAAVLTCAVMVGSAAMVDYNIPLTENISITASAAISTSKILQVGSRGTQVKYLQINLNILNYNAGTADGVFGNGTKNAVKRFQRAYGLTADGVAGKNTIEKLNDVCKQLQKDLNSLGYKCGTADGILGTNSVNAIKKFQRTNGLTADGIAGSQTLNKINYVKNNKNSAVSSGAQSAVNTATSSNKTEKIRSSIVSLANSKNGSKGLTYQKWAGLSSSQPWCVAYATYIANQAIKSNGGSTSVTPTSGAYRTSTSYLAKWFRNKGRYYSFTSWKGSSTKISMDKTCSTYNYTPKVGDFAIIDNNGKFSDGPEHTAIVVAVNGSTITLSEGNTGGTGSSKTNTVNKYTYKRNSNGYWYRTNWSQAKIIGFASPNY